MRALLGIASIFVAAAPAQAQAIKAVKVAEGFHWPVWIGAAPGDDSRLFVIEMNRGVRVIENGFLLPDRFLDLASILVQTGQGLLGMAFHPDYQSNGRFFVVYQDEDWNSLLSEWRVSSDPNLADHTSEVVLLGPVLQPGPIHNWNTLHFGPDGMLYAATGDGCCSNDPNNHGQRLDTLFGKLLRLDVDAPAPHIPWDNPFVGSPGAREEIWAYGLREPWRFSFDRETGDLWVGDTGESSWEEINFQPASSAGKENYGWRCFEGTQCTGNGGCDCADPNLRAPVHEYAHSSHGVQRCAVIGGYVYRGSAISSMRGRYFFGDFCGGIMSLAFDGSVATDVHEHTQELAPCDQDPLGQITTFGEDGEGELYFATSLIGDVYKIVPNGATVLRYCEALDNSVGPGAEIRHGGSTSEAANDFRLQVDGAPPSQKGYFFYGREQNKAPLGNGIRCVGGNTWRFGAPLATDDQGHAERWFDNQRPTVPGSQIAAGETFYFQFWYRDPAAGGAGFNFSDALMADFCP